MDMVKVAYILPLFTAGTLAYEILNRKFTIPIVLYLEGKIIHAITYNSKYVNNYFKYFFKLKGKDL